MIPVIITQTNFPLDSDHVTYHSNLQITYLQQLLIIWTTKYMIVDHMAPKMHAIPAKLSLSYIRITESFQLFFEYFHK